MQWVDKYRPNRLDDIIGQDNIKELLNMSIQNGNMPNLLFHGAPGTGKTSTASSIVMQLYGPHKIDDNVLELNASDENGIGVIRDKIIRYAGFSVGPPDVNYANPTFKTIILDEADTMTSEAQTALKKVMESTCNITRFIIICNYDAKIINAIKSRCADFKFVQISNDIMIQKLKYIAEREKMQVPDDIYSHITRICKGDARRSINTLQNLKYLPVITEQNLYNITSFIDDKYIDQYWKYIVSSEISHLKPIVQDIINSGFPIINILNCIKDKIIISEISDKKKADIIIFLGKIERMIIKGSDTYIQVFAVLTYINTMYRNIKN